MTETNQTAITNRLTTALSVIMAALIPFPFIIAGFESIFEEAGLICFCFGIAAGIISWGTGACFGIAMKPALGKSKRILLRFSTVIVCGIFVLIAEAYLSAVGIGGLALMFAPAAMGMWCWFGFRHSSGQEMMRGILIGFFCFEMAFMYPISASFETRNSIGTTTLMIIAALMIVLGALYFNRKQLDELAMSRRGSEKLISKSSRSFNIKGALGFSGIVLGTFFFVGYLSTRLWEAIAAIIQFLLDRFNNPMLETEEEPPDWAVPDLEVKTLFNSQPFWWIVITGAVILAVILLRKPIMMFIREFLDSMKKRFNKMEQTNEGYYTDVYQELDRNIPQRNAFKKTVKAFKREKDPTKRFRLGYKAFMIKIGEKEERTNPSDTTRIHLKKGRSITDFEDLDKVVDAYCDIRYGEREAETGDCEIMGRLINKLK